MESPTHHDATPQGMAFSTTPTVQTYWTSAPEHNISDQVVDVEFEAPLEEGMMSTGEVEMNTAPLYGEEYEYEMAYDGGNSETNFVVEESEVVDTELVDATEVHQPHVDGGFVPFVPVETEHEHSAHLVQPALTGETLAGVTTPKQPDVAADVVSLPTESAPSQDTEEQGVYEETNGGGEEPPHEESAAPAPSLESVSPTTKAPEAPATVLETDVVASQEASQQTAEPNPALDTSSSALDVAPAVEQAAEEYTTEIYEETEAEERYDSNTTPVLLSTSSENSDSSSLIALFKHPDLSLIPSSSTATDASPILFLDQQQSLYTEPITTLLLHLRKELLEAQPHVIPPSAFEYKEIQLVARDLQLNLTEDNIYAREITLFDLVSMHQSCGLSGYLHFDLSLQPRFIDRYRAIRQAIDNHANAQPSGTTDQAQNPAVDNEPIRNEDESNVKLNATVEEGELQEEETREDGALAEPPLPPDEEEGADDWSEEQEEYEEEANVEDAENADTSEWTNEGEEGTQPATGDQREEKVAEGTQEEEYVHEDEFLPGDELPFPAGDYADGGDDYEEAQEITETADVTTDFQEYQEEAVPEETTVLVDEAEESASKEEQDTTAEEYGDEVYNEDFNEEWEEGEYEGDADADADDDADDAGPPPPEGASTLLPREVLEPIVLEPVALEDIPEGAVVGSEVEDNLRAKAIAGAHSLHETARKRSFSEVDEEPEPDGAHSPGIKKPRHA
ncbi:hypothetical protein FRC20_009501 [Serendipita sp. 405]|nr:hypothetical protein FRC20_009501 [Serendipita sp. 405]